MSLPSSIRAAIPLVIGLAVGGLGATLFLQSMPGPEGSPEARANRLEVELQRATNRIAAMEARDPQAGRRRPGRSLMNGARNIADDIREGRPVTPDDVFRAAQPLLRDLAPLFDRMRLNQQREITERLTGELSRKYNLTPDQQQALRQWFDRKAEDNAKAWNDLITRDGTRVQDLMRATRDLRPDDGLDAFMATTLSGEPLATFRTDRLAERAQRVQQDADTKVARLDAIVQLDPAQRDQMFGLMARSSRDYDPAMKLEGVTGDITTPATTANRKDAMLAILRPEQRAAYQAEQQRQRDQAAKNMEAMGMTLPPNWDPLDDRDFN